MAGMYETEVEPEVRSWLEQLADRDFGRVDFLVGLLAERAADLGELYTRHLGGKVRELRFHLLAQQPRVTAEMRSDTMNEGTAGTDGHASYEDLASRRRDSAEYREGYSAAERAFRIGLAVRERRLVLGLSQVELAARAKMTQPALSRLEAGGVIPTIPLLDRISAALDADLIVQISPRAA
jgi:DNA-binding XRE family transcriptional regulator